MNQTKISVIMPSLNVSKYIKQCLQSVLNQTLEDIEIICVDGGSTDGTLDIIQQYVKKDNRVKLIHSDIKSYGYQMNLGIKEASGDYIGIVETDDYIQSDMYERLYDVVVGNPEEEIDFVKGSYNQIAECKGKVICLPFTRDFDKSMLNRVLDLSEERNRYDLNHIWSGIYRRDFLIGNSLWFNETMGASFQDTSFSLLINLVAERCVYIGYEGYNYRTDNEGSSVKSDTKIDCVIREYEYVVNKLKQLGLYDDVRKRLVLINKLYTYKWNYIRLSEQSAAKFFDLIQDEMKEYDVDNVLRCSLTNEQREILTLLTNSEEVVEIRNNQESAEKSFYDLLDRLTGFPRAVIVSAGEYCRRIVQVQEFLSLDFIEAICDNSLDVQGTNIFGYIVDSIDNVVKKYTDDYFVIANKKYSEQIYNQLMELGVSKNKVIKCTALPSGVELLELCVRYSPTESH